ncbi:MAG TPA: hypothetical protein VHG32_06760 [Thermoanaerobaculia bacterium]|jgi:hypothetical protein|nr:hypothetical protein [Thermoanaerobaculia bacterium]
MADPIHRLLAAAREDGARQIFLVHGDLVLAEPAALAVASGLAAHHGGRVEAHRRPTSLGPLLQDLRTFSLFGSAKVLLAIDTFVFADRSAAADLIDDAGEALPLAAGDDGAPALSARERQAASRLMQALRLFEIETAADGEPAERLLAQLPAWVFEGGKAARRGRGGRARGKRQVEELREGLAALLEAARREGIEGRAEGDLSDLAELISGGLPAGHFLVFAERDVSRDHPLARLLGERGAVAAVGEVEADRGGWQGVDLLAAELERQTGIGISHEALAELARRTLRKPGDRPAAGRGGEAAGATVTADSTARLAAEYRKLANLAQAAGGGRIERRMVEEAVEDRGEEDVWKLLDAIGAGHGGEAMDRLQRLLVAADDPAGARLGFFALLATFCRRLTAIRGMMRVARVRGGETNYNRFAANLAPALQGELPGGKNPLAGVNPWALFRAYLAASRLPEAVAARLPWEVLETELQLKGESGEADAALAGLVIRLSAAARGGPAAAPARGSGAS